MAPCARGTEPQERENGPPRARQTCTLGGELIDGQARFFETDDCSLTAQPNCPNADKLPSVEGLRLLQLYGCAARPHRIHVAPVELAILGDVQSVEGLLTLT